MQITIVTQNGPKQIILNTELLSRNATCKFYKCCTFLVIVAEYRYVFLSLGMIFNILSTCSSGKVKVYIHINKEVIFLYKKTLDYFQRKLHWIQEWLQNFLTTKMFEVNWLMNSLFPQKTYHRISSFCYRQI